MNPIILSFDVGIVNLSYCLLTKHVNSINWHIIEWNNIDLTQYYTKLCYCGSKACYTNIINNKSNYYCKKHLSTCDYSNIKYEDLFDSQNDKTIQCCYMINSKNSKRICDKPSSFKLKDDNTKYFCNFHGKQYYTNIVKISNIKEIKIKKSTTFNFNDIKYSLLMELEKRFNLLSANYVVIENQPSFKNPRMKSIASTLYDYYLIRGIIDKQITSSNILEVKFLSPSNKLKLIDEKDSKKLKENENLEDSSNITKSSSKTYKLTKNLSIKYCSDIIDNLPEWKKIFKENKKKDDLADAFLQGIYFYNLLESNNS
jgi:hypothetical protein